MMAKLRLFLTPESFGLKVTLLADSSVLLAILSIFFFH